MDVVSILLVNNKKYIIYFYLYILKIKGHRVEKDEGWISSRGMNFENDLSGLYLDSLYFAFITMITVGYGDVNYY